MQCLTRINISKKWNEILKAINSSINKYKMNNKITTRTNTQTQKQPEAR